MAVTGLSCQSHARPRPANGTVPIGDLHPSLEGRLDNGELYVRGPQRFAGYLDPADNTGRFLTPDGTPHDPATPLTDAHWYRTGDRVGTLAGPPGPTGRRPCQPPGSLPRPSRCTPEADAVRDRRQAPSHPPSRRTACSVTACASAMMVI
jgi:hypothetical protein